MTTQRKRRWLRRIAWTGLLLSVALAGCYSYFTHPARLRAAVAELCLASGLRLEESGAVAFSPFSGLHLADLTIRDLTPSRAERAIGRHSPPLLHITSARIAADLRSLLFGTFRPTRIDIDGLTVCVIRRGRDEPPDDSDQTDGRALLFDTTQWLPPARVRKADVQLLEQRGSRLTLLRRWLLSAEGVHEAAGGQSPPRYVLRVEQVGGSGDPLSGQSRTPLGLLEWSDARLDVQIGWLESELIAPIIAPELTEVCSALALQGHVRAPRMAFDERGLREAEIQFADTRLAPLIEEAQLPPADRFVQITRADGRLTLRRNEDAAPAAVQSPTAQADAGAATLALSLELKGCLNDATAELSLNSPRVRIDRPRAAGRPEDSSTARTLDLGPYELTVRTEPIEFPDPRRHARFISSQRLPGPMRALLEDYLPRGRVSIAFDVLSSSLPDEPPQVLGSMELHDARCRYFRFPYDIDQIHGRVRFEGGSLILDGVRGRHGSAQIHGFGRIFHTNSWTALDLTFVGLNVPLDRALYEALPETDRSLWQEASPLGLADVTTHILRDEGSRETGPPEPTISVDVHMRSGSMTLENHGRLTQVDGRIRIDQDRILLDDLTGFLGRSMVRLDGYILRGGAADQHARDLRIQAADFPLSTVSRMAYAPADAQDSVRFEGHGDVWGQVSGFGHDADQAGRYAVRIRDGRLWGFDGHQLWPQVRGWMAVGDAQRRSVDLVAERHAGRMDVHATMLPAESGVRIADLQLSATDAAMEELLRGVVPGRWAQFREALGIRGAGRLQARVENSPDPPDQGLRARVDLWADFMAPAALPLDFRDAHATVIFTPDCFTVRHAEAVYGSEGVLRARGEGGWSPGGAWTDMSLVAEDIELDAALISSLPGGLAQVLAPLEPRGMCNAELSRIRIDTRDQLAWDVEGRLHFSDATLQAGLPLERADGDLTGRFRVTDAGATEIQASFVIDGGIYGGRPIQMLEGRLLRDPNDAWVRVEDLSGRMCDGEVVGWASFHPASSEFELTLTLRNLDLSQFLNRKQPETRPADTPTQPGRVDGRVFLRGKRREPQWLSGGGQLLIRGGSLLNTRVSAELVGASPDRRPRSDAVQEAELRFVWHGDELQFSRVDIRTRDTRYVGTGSWNQKTDAVDLTLLAASPDAAGGLGPVIELFQAAQNELIQYRVTGTARAPQVRIEPLYGVTDTLRNIIEGR